MKKILVTGAGGYIGSIASYMLLQKGYEVVAIDNFITGYKAPLELLTKEFGRSAFRFYQKDLNDDLSDFFAKEKKIEAVLHYAAHCLVDESMKNPSKYFRNNTGGSANLLHHLAKNEINKIIFSSTCAVYGEASYVPIDEKHKTVPANPYGESKRMVEQMLDWHCRLDKLDYVILRYFNVCGASDDGKIGDSKRPSVLLVQNAVRGALNLEPFYLTFPKVDTPDGSPIRDYINVVDLNQAHILALQYLFNGGKSEIINLGTGTGNSVLEIVKKVEEATNTKIKRQIAVPRQGEYAKMIADTSRAKKVLNWQPTKTLDDSINSLVSWYHNNPQGWQE